jgi:subtilase family serine protease
MCKRSGPFFSLPANDPKLILAKGSPDPGPHGSFSGDCNEAYLDVEWSGGVASGATIDYV